jgi:glutamate synthase (NADPH/NADH) large chain
MRNTLPKNQGLYNQENEHDACGIGFVADIKGRKSHSIVERGLEVVIRMEHRGAESADNKTGDGAGIMIQMPHAFLQSQVPDLPEAGHYGTGLIFLPQDTEQAAICIQEFEQVVCEEGLSIISWRDVPVDSCVIGDIARSAEPVIKQVFVSGQGMDQVTLERKLYVVRKLTENRIRNSNLSQKDTFYPVSLSTRTLLYKGMFMPNQLGNYYLDLQDERLESAIALVHSRFSTNTFPSWDLAQPFRLLAHNGEINTIKGNRFWIQAREASLESPIFGDDIKKLLPIIEPSKSDSASFDNILEMLVATGRSLPHALMMLIPESFNKLNPIPDDVKYFYEYHSSFMEPWDGPAAMIFCDGRFVGGTLDRNGLRPSRYVVTKDDLIVMGSEVGVQIFEPDQIAQKGRLRPGKILLVDTEEQRIIPDEEIKDTMSHQRPYREWVEQNRITLKSIDLQYPVSVGLSETQLHKTQLLFGYTREDLEKVIIPMVTSSKEPTASMGTDTPLAVFSDKPQLLFNYFKQTFAQVTNPPIDPIREELVMSLISYIGKENSLLTETSEHCKMVQFRKPIFTNADAEKIKTWDNKDFRTAVLPMVFPVSTGASGLENALQRLGEKAAQLVDEGYSFIILSDRDIDATHAPIPSLLACASVHHHLIRVGKRTEIALIVETAEAREVMHFALLFSYGASAVNPYGAFATILDLLRKRKLNDINSYSDAEENYVKAIDKGLLKILSKLGISTLRSYQGAQTFEAIGISPSGHR